MVDIPLEMFYVGLGFLLATIGVVDVAWAKHKAKHKKDRDSTKNGDACISIAEEQSSRPSA